MDDHFAYIAGDNLDAAVRFLHACREGFRKLADFPGMGALREFESPHLHDVRSWPIKGFENYLIFYRPAPALNGIQVIRILHGARDIDRIFES